MRAGKTKSKRVCGVGGSLSDQGGCGLALVGGLRVCDRPVVLTWERKILSALHRFFVEGGGGWWRGEESTMGRIME